MRLAAPAAGDAHVEVDEIPGGLHPAFLLGLYIFRAENL